MTEQDVKDWTEYYMGGGELPDDIQQEILAMALKSTRAPVSDLEALPDAEKATALMNIIDDSGIIFALEFMKKLQRQYQ